MERRGREIVVCPSRFPYLIVDEVDFPFLPTGKPDKLQILDMLSAHVNTRRDRSR